MTEAQRKVLKIFDELYAKGQWKSLDWIAERAETSQPYSGDVLRKFRRAKYEELSKNTMSRHHHWKKPYPAKMCSICSKRFSPRWPNQVTCTVECSHRWRCKKNSRRSNQRRKERAALPKIKVCQQCGTGFVFLHLGRMKYCSDACARVVRLRQQRKYNIVSAPHPSSRLRPGKCEACGTACMVHQRKKTCSTACSQQLRKDRQKLYRKEGRYKYPFTSYEAMRDRENKHQQQLAKDLDTLRRFIDEQSNVVTVG